MVASQTTRNNIGCMRQIIQTVFGEKTDVGRFSLNDLSWSIVARFQQAMVARYQKAAPPDDAAQREARDRALRTSRSMVAQARSLFNRLKDLPKQYEAMGITIPSGVNDFMTCRLHGRMAKREYLSPPDSVVRAAFNAIEDVKLLDPNAYVAFWFAVGAGLRRKEIQQLCWEHLVERDGHLRVSGPIGKNGEKVEVPMQSRAVAAIEQFRQPVGRVMGREMGLEWAKRVNLWMRQAGWRSEKRMHELRACVGSLLYQANPLYAMKFMRLSSIRITEQFYVCYGKPLQPVDVL